MFKSFRTVKVLSCVSCYMLIPNFMKTPRLFLKNKNNFIILRASYENITIIKILCYDFRLFMSLYTRECALILWDLELIRVWLKNSSDQFYTSLSLEFCSTNTGLWNDKGRNIKKTSKRNEKKFWYNGTGSRQGRTVVLPQGTIIFWISCGYQRMFDNDTQSILSKSTQYCHRRKDAQHVLSSSYYTYIRFST